MRIFLTGSRKKILFLALCFLLGAAGLFGKLLYLMIDQADYLQQEATSLHQRERKIKAKRGLLLDRNGVVLADNRAVCTISVIYRQVKEPELVIAMLVEELGLSEEEVRKKVEKVSSREIIKTNVEKEIGDRIREKNFSGVKVDEDYKRYYPYGTLGSKVLGFTGSDNQGILGLEVYYDDILMGTDGSILTITDAAGRELLGQAEVRTEPVAGKNLKLTMDYNIQAYATQAAHKVLEEKQAKSVSVILMNPKNGEILAMVNAPEYDLNDPFTLSGEGQGDQADLLNEMWRNGAINDTYEPGSAFKIITMAAGLEEGVVSPEEHFSCGGSYTVANVRIRCHKTTGHGAETFVEAAGNSCNPVFIQVGMRLGVDTFYEYFRQLGLLKKNGIDLPGEASIIMHKKENMKEVELATVSFGQSFQITPLELLTTVSGLINGGTAVTPHLGMTVISEEGEMLERLEFPAGERVPASPPLPHW